MKGAGEAESSPRKHLTQNLKVDEVFARTSERKGMPVRGEGMCEVK